MSISLESLTQQLQETAKVIALVPEFKKKWIMNQSSNKQVVQKIKIYHTNGQERGCEIW